METNFDAEAARKYEKETELKEVLTAIISAIDNKMSQCYISYQLKSETIIKLGEMGYFFQNVPRILGLIFNTKYIIRW